MPSAQACRDVDWWVDREGVRFGQFFCAFVISDARMQVLLAAFAAWRILVCVRSHCRQR